MRVAVKDGGHGVPAERLFETAATQIRIDLLRLAFHSPFDGRVVQQHDLLFRPKPRERRFELQRFVHGLVHEQFCDLLPPGPERSSPEPSHESLHAGKAYPFHLTRVTVEHEDTVVGQDVADFLLGSRLEVVIPQYSDDGNAYGGGQLFNEPACLVRGAVVGEIACD